MGSLAILKAKVEALMMDGKARSRIEIEDEIGEDTDIAIAVMWQHGQLTFDPDDATYTINTEHMAALQMLKDGNL